MLFAFPQAASTAATGWGSDGGGGGDRAIGNLPDRWTAGQGGSCRHEALELGIPLEHPVHARRKGRYGRIGKRKLYDWLTQTRGDESRMYPFEK